MATCIGTRIDVSFRDDKSHIFSEFEKALFSHFNTNEASADTASLLHLPDGFKPILVHNLANNAQVCIAKLPHFQPNTQQKLFPFYAYVIGQGQDQSIDQQIKDFEKSLHSAPGSLIKVSVHKETNYHLYATSSEGVYDSENTFTLVRKRPSLKDDLLGRVLITVIAFIIGLCTLVASALFLPKDISTNTDIANQIGWILLTISLTELVNVIYIKALKKVDININEVASTSSAISHNLSRTERLTNDSEIINQQPILLTPSDSRRANAVLISNGKAGNSNPQPNTHAEGEDNNG